MDADNCPTVGGQRGSEHETVKTGDDLSEGGSITLRGTDTVFCVR